MLGHRLLATAAVCVLSVGGGFDATAADPPKKDWEELRDNPIDYAPFERRRAENLKLGIKPSTQALAQGFARDIDVGTYPVLTDVAVTKGLALEMEKLLQAEKLQLKAPRIEFVVVDDLGLVSELQAAGQNNEVLQKILAKETSNFTALSTGGGAIVVGLSLLKTVKNYDELDFILMHEASHILYDHFTEDERKDKIGKAIAVLAVIAGLATRNASSDTKETVGWTTLGLIVANALLGPAWDREQEREADALSYELMMEYGRSEEGVTNMLERFQQRDDALKAYLDAICGTDSVGDILLKSLVGNIFGIRIPQEGYDPSSPVCQERRNLFAALFKTHPETKDRKKDFEKHSKKFYPNRDPVPLVPIGNSNASVLEFLSPNGDAIRAVRAYDGITAFHRGDLATARRMVQALTTKGDQETQLPVLELNFYVANADGKRSDALRYLELATKAPQTTLRYSRMAEEEYARDARWADAARILQRRMLLTLAPPEVTYPPYINYLRLAGKTQEMERALADCKAAGNPGLSLACEATAHPPPTAPIAPAPAAASQ